jgi:hypothetical protein
MKRFPLIVVLFFWVAVDARATIINAANCTTAAVQIAINASSPGDTVVVPAGTCSLSVSISGISMIGAGKSSSGTVITSGTITMTKHATQITRLSGFRFTGTDIHASVSGAPSARAFVIDTNYFFSDGSNIFITNNANGGLYHHNDFFSPTSTAGGPDAIPLHPGEDWSQATTMGMADTQGPSGGERNLYFENNTFTNVLETAPDGDQGVRVVLRYNQYTDSSIVFHGGGPVNDTSTSGTRQFEIYNNTFSRVNGVTDNLSKWIWVRGGSGVIVNNVMDSLNTGTWSGNAINFGIGCVGTPAYPIEHQIGQTTEPTTENPPSHPLLLYGNTGAGSSGQPGIAGNDSGGGGHTCSTPATYVQSGRDYVTSNTWGWTPFTYPHPLAAGSPPVAPTITSANIATFTVGSPGSFTVTASGSTPITFTESGSLPSGVTLASSGLLAGTPGGGTAGSYPITITAANGTVPNGTQSFTLIVAGGAGGGGSIGTGGMMGIRM